MSMQELIRLRKRIGARVQFLSRQRGWSQERLAIQSGLARSFIAQIERGEKAVRMSTLCKIVGALKVTFAELMENVDDFSDSLRLKGRSARRSKGEAPDILADLHDRERRRK